MNEKQKNHLNDFKTKLEKKDFSKFFNAPVSKELKRRGKEEINYINEKFSINENYRDFGVGKKYLITTYGCQMNEHDTEVMAGILEALSFEATTDEEAADIIILNTCAIRENAENKVFGELGSLKKYKTENPDKIIAVAGCMSQEESVVNKILTKYQWVDLIFGTHNIHKLAEYVATAYFSKEKVIEVWSKEGDVIENLPKLRKQKVSAWVNIMYGCDKFCTYCIVPQTRGKERSRLPEDIINEVKELVLDGFSEITLLGQNVNAYGKDLKIDSEWDLGRLMEEVSKLEIPRIRFTTSHPWDFNDNLIEALKRGGNIMPYLHLPVQSGNTQMLKLMGRKYTREDYLSLIKKIKERVPNLSISTDIIVGFPNETDEQFEDTISLYNEVKFDHAYTFIYSARENTPAAVMKDNVDMDTKKQRLYRLNDLVNEYSIKANLKFENTVQKVLVVGPSKKNENILSGYTPHSKLVNFPGDESDIGKIIDVKITKAFTWHLQGEK